MKIRCREADAVASTLPPMVANVAPRNDDASRAASHLRVLSLPRSNKSDDETAHEQKRPYRPKPKLPIAYLSANRSSLMRTAGASANGRRWAATIDARLPGTAKDLFRKSFDIRTLIQSRDRREADKAEGGI